jgi:endogenous inhibitor of DNA gyrase (YacG/DUF329 family)
MEQVNNSEEDSTRIFCSVRSKDWGLITWWAKTGKINILNKAPVQIFW